MGNEKYSFLKQWFTFTFDRDKSTMLIYACSNNHYIHTWLEEHGYVSFKNTMSKDDLDLFIHALNESSNMIPDDFSVYFPDEYVKCYSLWDMDRKTHWSDISSYREHAKEQMSVLFENLWDVQNMIEHGTKGVLEYHMYYSH
jgi:hypothetical protein